MAISWFAGNDLRGLSSDTKPTAPDGTMFFETDTGSVFVVSSGSWVGVDPSFSLSGYPPNIQYKDTDEITIPAGRYYQAGHRFGGQYQDLDRKNFYWDVADSFAVDIDAVYSAGSISGMLGGKVNSSWYSVFMVAADEIVVLPFLRVDVIGYSSGDGYTVINPASQADGTTAENGFLTADDQFNGYRLVLINDDPTESGNVYTILDSGNYTPDGIAISGDITADVAATEWLQMIPSDGTAFLFLGTVQFDGSGNLAQFTKNGWRYTKAASVQINGALGVNNAANADLGPAVPPTATAIIAKGYVEATANTVGYVYYYGSSGSNNVGQETAVQSLGTPVVQNIHRTGNIPITVPGWLRNVFFMTGTGNPTYGYFLVHEYFE